MAKNTKKDTASKDAKVTRIKATDEKPVAKKTKATKPSAGASVSSPKKSEPKKQSKQRRNPFAPIAGYFKGAWQELKLVRWPTRRATWGMTAAVLLYTALFVAIIIVLDLGFNKLLETMLG